MKRIQNARERSRLGQLLVAKGIISEDQLRKAIEQQQQSGQRLGEILTEWNLATRRQINNVLLKQRSVRTSAALITALMGPLQAFAAVPAPLPQFAGAASSQRSSGMQALSEEELGDVSGQGITQDSIRALVSNAKDGSIKDLAKLMNPLLMMFESEMSIKNVAYDADSAMSVINPDGSITLHLSTTIGELKFSHIRVRGTSIDGPSFGTLTISNLDLRGTTITITPR